MKKFLLSVFAALGALVTAQAQNSYTLTPIVDTSSLLNGSLYTFEPFTLNYNTLLFQDFQLSPFQAGNSTALPPTVQIDSVCSGADVTGTAYTFESSVDGVTFATWSGETFAFTLLNNGTTGLHFQTNFPAAFYQNKTSIRLVSAINGSGTTTNYIKVQIRGAR